MIFCRHAVMMFGGIQLARHRLSQHGNATLFEVENRAYIGSCVAHTANILAVSSRTSELVFQWLQQDLELGAGFGWSAMREILCRTKPGSLCGLRHQSEA